MAQSVGRMKAIIIVSLNYVKINFLCINIIHAINHLFYTGFEKIH